MRRSQGSGLGQTYDGRFGNHTLRLRCRLKFRFLSEPPKILENPVYGVVIVATTETSTGDHGESEIKIHLKLIIVTLTSKLINKYM